MPASVFAFCGYDAVEVCFVDERGLVLEETDQYFISMDAPIHLSLNNGAALSLKAGESSRAALRYDSNLFLDRQLENNGSVSYSVADPSITSVDENGSVTGLSAGITTLTATLLPSGRSVETTVTVSPAEEGGSGSWTGTIVEPTEPEPEEETGDKDSIVITAAEIAALTEDTLIVELPGGTVTLDAETLKAVSAGEKDVVVTVKDNGDGSLNPKGNATRAEVAALLQRMVGLIVK